MIIDDYLGNDFLKAVDLGTTTPTIVISKVEPVELDEGKKKLVLHPVDPAMKPVVLNVTNTRALAAAFGNDDALWIGKQVLLSVRQTNMGPGIGVTPLVAPAAAAPAPAAAAPGAAGPTSTDVPFNDAIPY